jgi:hypothetical protein
VVLLVLEAHRALHLGRGVDEEAQRVARQRVVVAAGRDELELAGLVVAALGVAALEQEALDLVGRVEQVAVLLERSLGEAFRRARMSASYGVPSASCTSPNTSTLPGRRRRTAASRTPASRSQAQVRLGLLREAADRRAVERQVVGSSAGTSCRSRACAAALEVGEADGDGLDALLVASGT